MVGRREGRLAARPACRIESVKSPGRSSVCRGVPTPPPSLSLHGLRQQPGAPQGLRFPVKPTKPAPDGLQAPSSRGSRSRSPQGALWFRKQRPFGGSALTREPSPLGPRLTWEAREAPASLTFPATPRGNKAPPDLQGRAGGGRSGEGRPPTPASPPPVQPPPRPAAAAPGSPDPAPAATASRDGGPGLFPAPPACSLVPGPAGHPSAPLPGQALASAPHASCGSGGGAGFARPACSWDCAA